MAAFAQTTPSQTQAATSTSAQLSPAADQQVRVTGCIQKEADYRRAMDAGRGGVAGTGVGAANEFVLINASMSTGTASAGTPTGTAGTAGAAYELSGANESQASQYAGQRVEISGILKTADVAASGRPTGGVTAGKPPEGIDIAGQDLKLRELEVASIKQVSGSCSAQ